MFLSTRSLWCNGRKDIWVNKVRPRLVLLSLVKLIDVFINLRSLTIASTILFSLRLVLYRVIRSLIVDAGDRPLYSLLRPNNLRSRVRRTGRTTLDAGISSLLVTVSSLDPSLFPLYMICKRRGREVRGRSRNVTGSDYVDGTLGPFVGCP